MRSLRSVLIFSVAVLGCGSDPGADESGSASETNGESAGDGDGDGDGDSGDGDGDSGDGDGDTGDGDCPPPDPPLAQTLDGEWAELADPMPGFDCTLGEGDGPNWGQGVIINDGD